MDRGQRAALTLAAVGLARGGLHADVLGVRRRSLELLEEKWKFNRLERGPLVLGADGVHYLTDDRVEGEDPLAGFSANAARHLRRTDGFAHVADIMVGSFYDHQLDEGCAFEELISFHGGMGGPQTRPFLLHPADLPVPAEPIVGAEAAHDVLADWRRALQGGQPAGAGSESA